MQKSIFLNFFKKKAKKLILGYGIKRSGMGRAYTVFKRKSKNNEQ